MNTRRRSGTSGSHAMPCFPIVVLIFWWLGNWFFLENTSHGAKLHEGVGTLLIHTLQPRADAVRGDQELSGCLLQRPATGRLQLKDGHLLRRAVMGSAMAWDLRRAELVNAEFLLQEGDLLISAVQLCLQSDPGVWAVGCPAPGVGQRDGIKPGVRIIQWRLHMFHGQLCVRGYSANRRPRVECDGEGRGTWTRESCDRGDKYER